MLPKDYKARKALPLYSFLTQYFPDAIVELTKVAVAGNVQHNPGETLHWARGKSMDQMNTAMRHIFDHGMGNVYDEEPPEVLACIGNDGTMHLAKAAWRLLAEIQLTVEKKRDAEANTRGDSQTASGCNVEAPQGVLPQAGTEWDGSASVGLPREPQGASLPNRDESPSQGPIPASNNHGAGCSCIRCRSVPYRR